jgi:hypothetical protein|tara:strand:+ start:1529 stop:1765 length:237 start_codon:yes stop_codon:yes gene_type:complete
MTTKCAHYWIVDTDEFQSAFCKRCPATTKFGRISDMVRIADSFYYGLKRPISLREIGFNDEPTAQERMKALEREEDDD